ncbi:MAG: hypothetical protein IH793_11870, partial [Acidobacteria bacterium]|nr:hypothetical protein [Acidobacteriota bacterium]
MAEQQGERVLLRWTRPRLHADGTRLEAEPTIEIHRAFLDNTTEADQQFDQRARVVYVLPAQVVESFRHGGPKPKTREAAIMMLSDACEGISRTLDEPKPARLEEMVHGVVMKRLTDGQFDACPITMSELGTVEEALVSYLVNHFHHRIKYQYQLEQQRKEEEERERSRRSENRAR